MTTKSAKAKGRRLQKAIAYRLTQLDPDGEYTSTTMGEAGTDVQDPYYCLPWDYLECRAREEWPNLSAIQEELESKGNYLWAAVYKRNRGKQVWVVSDPVMDFLLQFYFDGLRDPEDR